MKEMIQTVAGALIVITLIMIYSRVTDMNIPKQSMSLFDAICQVESGGDARAYNEREGARGIAQIRPIMIDDCNRIVGSDIFTLEDCFDVYKSKEMFDIYMSHYCSDFTDEQKARCWNGGPRGYTKEATVKYWNKVKGFING